MTPARISILYFSPTGGTRRVARMLLAALRSARLPLEEINLTPFEARRKRRTFGPGDLVLVCVPSYYGRVALPMQNLNRLSGEGALAVPVAVYGNREYDDTLRELSAFSPLAASRRRPRPLSSRSTASVPNSQRAVPTPGTARGSKPLRATCSRNLKRLPPTTPALLRLRFPGTTMCPFAPTFRLRPRPFSPIPSGVVTAANAPRTVPRTSSIRSPLR